LRASYGGNVPPQFPLHRHTDAVTADEAIQFLTSNQHKSFFAMVDMSLPHTCYHTFPSMPAAGIPLQELPAPPLSAVETASSVEQALRKSKDLEHFGDEDRRFIRRAYYTMCEFADRQVLRILETLDALHLAENTLVIYTADHGDFAGDHNCFEKWDTVFSDNLVRVPLLMRLPGNIRPNTRCDAMVELIDLFPTLLEIIQLEYDPRCSSLFPP